MRAGRLLAAGLLLAAGGCVPRSGPFFFYPAASVDDRIGPAASNSEPDTDGGDMSVTCRPGGGLVFTRSWVDRPVAWVAARAGGAGRRIAVAYQPGGIGLAVFALPAGDPLVAALGAGRALRLRYADGHRILIPAGPAIRYLFGACNALTGPNKSGT